MTAMVDGCGVGPLTWVLDTCRDRGKRKHDRTPALAKRRKTAGGPQGRFASLCDGQAALLDRHPPPCARDSRSGRRDGLSIKQRDGRKGEHQFPYIPMSFQAV